MIQITIQKRDLYFLLIFLGFLGIAGFVIAYGSGNPLVMGHSINELETCEEGESLKVSGGEWICDSSGGAGSGIIVGGGLEYVPCGTTGFRCSGEWGSASCGTYYLVCPSGSTKRQTSIGWMYCEYGGGTHRYFLCVTD